MDATTSESDLPALDRLRALILADETLQHQLIELADPHAFAAAAARVAAREGIPLSEGEILDAAQPDRLGLDRFSPRPPTGCEWPGRQWVPVALAPTDSELAVDWLNMAGTGFTRPFLKDTIRLMRSRPLNRFIRPRTPLSMLAERAPPDGGRIPDGLIFHMSRCGSTLAAQMLAADPGNIVPSEPELLDAVVELLQQHKEVPLDERARLLRAVVGALGRNRTGKAGHFVIKLDSWHTLALPLFRAAFPDVPWAYLYREPVEVVMSHVAMRGVQVVPGGLPGVYGIPDEQSVAPDDFLALALSRICDAVVDNWHLGGGLLINYRDLPGAVESSLLSHFGIVPDPRTLESMAAAARKDAKVPDCDFVSDSTAKRQAATPEHLATAEKIRPSYLRLEALREATAAQS